MRIIYAVDLHVHLMHLDTLLQLAVTRRADAVIIGGDLVPKSIYHGVSAQGMLEMQREYLRDDMVPELKKFREKNPEVEIYLDLGNDDFIANRDVLEQTEGPYRLLHMRKHALTEGVDIVGYMNVPITPFGIKDWERADSLEEPATTFSARLRGIYSRNGKVVEGSVSMSDPEKTIESDLEQLSDMVDKPFILVCHTPPYGTNLDMLYSGEHVGSKAVRRFIDKWAADGRLLGSFHGHIHESPEVSGATIDYIGGVPCVNPGQRGELQHVEFEVKGDKMFL